MLLFLIWVNFLSKNEFLIGMTDNMTSIFARELDPSDNIAKLILNPEDQGKVPGNIHGEGSVLMPKDVKSAWYKVRTLLVVQGYDLSKAAYHVISHSDYLILPDWLKTSESIRTSETFRTVNTTTIKKKEVETSFRAIHPDSVDQALNYFKRPSLQPC